MNTVTTVSTSYLRPSRTIETVLVSNDNFEKAFFIFNYEGYHFRLFYSLIDLLHFFQDNHVESDFHFSTEEDLDLFLSKIDLVNEK